MCGRFTVSMAPDLIAEKFGLAEVPDLRPRYNVAPTQDVPVVRVEEPQAGRRLYLIRWGLLTPGAGAAGREGGLINARSESVHEKATFRWAFQHRRCLVLSDGFYEWQRINGRKQPYYVTFPDHRPFAYAGLWDRWRPPEGEPIESCTILTTDSNPLVKPIHDRMPVILGPGAYETWLDPRAVGSEGGPTVEVLAALLRPYPDDEMIAYPVSPLVNRPEHDAPDCVEPIDAPRGPEQADLFA